MRRVSVIVPTYYFKSKNGEPSRDFERLDMLIKSINSQDIEYTEVIVSDQTKNVEFINSIKSICKNNGARYLKNETSLIFNKSFLVNSAAKVAKYENIAIVELDMVFHKATLSRGLDVLEKGFDVVNTDVFYAKRKEDIINNLRSERGFFDISKIPGRNRIPSDDSRGVQGGIQIMKKDFFMEVLKGCNTNLNLMGYYDNDIVFRARKMGYKVEKLQKSVEEVFSVHIPHKKDLNFSFIPNNIVSDVRYFCGKAVFSQNVETFVSDDANVLGLRSINNNLVFGTDTDNISNFSRQDLIRRFM